MNAAATEEGGWSGLRWIATVLFVLALQLLVLYGLSGHGGTDSTPSASIPKIQFVDHRAVGARLAELLALQDPMVFAQASARGFSHVDWLSLTRLNYQMTNWTETYQWLAPADQYFADEFSQFVEKTVLPSALLTERVAPIFANVPLSAPTLPPRALVRVEDELAERHLISTQPPPLNEWSMLLTNTVVGLTVNRSGEILSTTLLSSSGFLQADRNALSFARETRFEPAPAAPLAGKDSKRDSLTFGRLVFQWFPASLVGTNQLTAKP